MVIGAVDTGVIVGFVCAGRICADATGLQNSSHHVNNCFIDTLHLTQLPYYLRKPLRLIALNFITHPRQYIINRFRIRAIQTGQLSGKFLRLRI